MNNLWKIGTQKAYYGYVGMLLIELIGGLILGMMEPSPLEVLMGEGSGYLATSIFFGTAAIAALVYYFMGIKEMKDAAVNSSIAEGTNRLFIAGILLVIGQFLGFFIGALGSLVGFIGFIVAWSGYALIKKNAANANAQMGGDKLTTSALLSFVAALCAFIPAIGWIIAGVLEFVALYYALQGWKDLANSELE